MHFSMMKPVVVKPSDVYTNPGARNNVSHIAEYYDILEFRIPKKDELYIAGPDGADILKATVMENAPRFIVKLVGAVDRLSGIWE